MGAQRNVAITPEMAVVIRVYRPSQPPHAAVLVEQAHLPMGTQSVDELSEGASLLRLPLWSSKLWWRHNLHHGDPWRYKCLHTRIVDVCATQATSLFIADE